MRICVIGNSHAGAIKQGWDRIAADYPGVSMQFFAAIGNMMGDLKPLEGRLVATDPSLAEYMKHSSGGSTEIRPDAYDLFLIVGLGLRLPKLDQRLSLQVRSAVFSELSSCLACRVARLVRAVSDAPILILAVPLQARPPSPEEAENPFVSHEACLQNVQEALAVENVQILSQPEETLASGWTTDRKWSEGSSTLAAVIGKAPRAVHPEGEFDHMNADFGMLWLSQILARLSSSPARSQ